MNIKECIKSGIIGGVISVVITVAIVYAVIPLPASSVENALGNGITALICGFMSAFMGLLTYMKKQNVTELQEKSN